MHINAAFGKMLDSGVVDEKEFERLEDLWVWRHRVRMVLAVAALGMFWVAEKAFRGK